MREIRLSGSEGGGTPVLPTPIVQSYTHLPGEVETARPTLFATPTWFRNASSQHQFVQLRSSAVPVRQAQGRLCGTESGNGLLRQTLMP
jgi:hypothetical protein